MKVNINEVEQAATFGVVHASKPARIDVSAVAYETAEGPLITMPPLFPTDDANATSGRQRFCTHCVLLAALPLHEVVHAARVHFLPLGFASAEIDKSGKSRTRRFTCHLASPRRGRE
jgi:hypothetical protein